MERARWFNGPAPEASMRDQISIVVGTDGSSHAADAVMWAAREAHRSGLPLRIVTVFQRWAGLRLGSDDVHSAQEEHARELLDEARDTVLTHFADLPVEAVLRSGEPVEELGRMSTDARLLVTGTRGRGGFTGMLLGSTSHSLTAHAAAPLVVVPGPPPPPTGSIVVGVDGSEEATRALDFAAEQAHGRQVPLVAVQVVAEPPWFGPTEVYGEWVQDVLAMAEEDLEANLAPIRQRFSHLEIHARVLRGHPADELRRAGDGAQLLVVGSHGRSIGRSVLVGSISHGVLHHASCPVAVLK